MSVESRLTEVEESLRLLGDATRLQGRPFSAKAPATDEPVAWNNTTKKWEPAATIAVNTINENTAASGVTVDGLLIKDEYLELDEISAPGAGAANKLRLYVIDGPSTATGGRATVPSFVDSAGVTTTIDSGVYTPTLSNGLNVAASTAYEAQWMRIGNVITVGGKFDCDPTDADTQTILGISLPVASNFGAEEDCGGAVGCRTITGAGAVLANISGDKADAQFFPTGTGNAAWGFTFTYQII